MEKLTLQPIARISGTVDLPGSKSLSNRILLLSALAEGETRIENLLESEDTEVMLAALRQLGLAISGEPGSGSLTAPVSADPGTLPLPNASTLANQPIVSSSEVFRASAARTQIRLIYIKALIRHNRQLIVDNPQNEPEFRRGRHGRGQLRFITRLTSDARLVCDVKQTLYNEVSCAWYMSALGH